MKIKGTPETLLPFFKAHNYLPSNNIIKELEYMKVFSHKGVLHGVATNLTHTIISTCECSIEGSGMIVISVAQVCDYLSKLPSTEKVEIEYNDGESKVVITTKGIITARYEMNTPSSSEVLGYLKDSAGFMDYLDIQDFEHHIDSWQWDALSGILLTTSANGGSRPILNGINIRISNDRQLFELTSTDSLRASVVKVDNNGDSTVVKSPTIQREMIRIMSSFVKLKEEDDAELSFSFFNKGEKVRFRYADNKRGVTYYVFGLTIGGEYPNVHQILPTSLRCSFRVNRDLLVGCFQRVNKLVKESNYKTNFEFNAVDDTLTISSGQQEVGNLKETISIRDNLAPEKKSYFISVSSSYFEELVKKHNSSEIVVDFPLDSGPLALYETKYSEGEYLINNEIQTIVMTMGSR